MADVAAALKDWSTTAGSNLPADATTLGAGLADNLQQIQATTRQLAASSTIASASTTDLSTINEAFISVTGTTTITALGTVSAGIWKVLTFSGALTLTYNATSLKLPGSASITTAAGDTAFMLSEGSGNWNCLLYQRKSGSALVAPASTFGDGTSNLPSITFTSDLDNGAYRIGSNNWALVCQAQSVAQFSPTQSTFQGRDSNASGSSGAIGAFGSGAGLTSGDGGRCYVYGGNGGTTGNGGSIWLTGGQGGSTSGNGGDIAFRAGETTSGTKGSLRFQLPDTAPDSVGLDATVVGPTGHWEESNDSGTPTITSGAGTGATIEGNDNLILVTFGTSPGTSIVVTFANAWTNAPAAFANYGAADLGPRCTTTTTTVTVTLTSAPTAGQVMQIWVRGWQT